MKLPGNMASIMQAAQSKMKNMEEEVKKKEAEASSGGDMVRVKVNGSGDVLSVKISPDVLKDNDPEMRISPPCRLTQPSQAAVNSKNKRRRNDKCNCQTCRGDGQDSGCITHRWPPNL